MEGAGVFLQGPPAGWLRAALGRSNPRALWPAGHRGGELCRAGRAVEPDERPDKGVQCCQGTRKEDMGAQASNSHQGLQGIRPAQPGKTQDLSRGGEREQRCICRGSEGSEER